MGGRSKKKRKRQATGAMAARRTKGAMAARRAKGAIGGRKSGRMDLARRRGDKGRRR